MTKPLVPPAAAGPVDLARLEALAEELVEWAEGRRSHTNEFMSVEWDASHHTQTLVHIAQADAAEVVRLSAAVQALNALAAPSLLAAARAVERVRAVHYARTITSWSDTHLDAEHDEGGDDCDEGECLAEHTICDGDGYAWPCTTVAALGGETE